jgi:hypothetical protein
MGVGLFYPAWTATVAAPLPYFTKVDDVVSRIARSDDQKLLNLEAFTVVRQYVLKNPRLSHEATMRVRWSYTKNSGKSYEILESRGAEGMAGKILTRVLEGEAEAATPAHRENSRLSAEHYEFHLRGMQDFRGRPCYVLDLRPRVKSRFVLAGTAWIDARDFSPVRVEGRPSANISFFVGKPYIVQEFQKIGDFYMASYHRALSESRILGDSELTIEYSDYDVRSIEGTRVALRQCTSRASLNN